MAIDITEVALRKIKDELTRLNLSPLDTALRMGVTGGGCSGLTYRLEFEPLTKKTEHDREFTFHFPDSGESDPRLTAVVDKKSYLYLNGITLDYVEQGLTGGFVFNNPKAKQQCGCGHSFST